MRPCQLNAAFMSETQVFFFASATVLFLRTRSGTILRTFGARSSRLFPTSHRSDQNKVFLPFPTVVTTEIANKAEVFE
jgi:hypothetical protein